MLSKLIILQRYLIRNPLPITVEEIDNVTEMMYQRMLAREEEAVQKIRQVINFATTDDCKQSYFSNGAKANCQTT